MYKTQGEKNSITMRRSLTKEDHLCTMLQVNLHDFSIVHATSMCLLFLHYNSLLTFHIPVAVFISHFLLTAPFEEQCDPNTQRAFH